MEDKLIYDIRGTKGNYSIRARSAIYPWISLSYGIKTRRECNQIILKYKINDK